MAILNCSEALDDLIESASSYAKDFKNPTGFITIGRSKLSSLGIDEPTGSSTEVNGVLGTEDGPIDKVIDVSNGKVVYKKE